MAIMASHELPLLLAIKRMLGQRYAFKYIVGVNIHFLKFVNIHAVKMSLFIHKFNPKYICKIREPLNILVA